MSGRATGGLGLSPRVWADGERLVVSTSIVLQALLLLSYDRQVTIDRRARRVEFDTRYLWLLHRRRRIPFEEVDHVDYDYVGVGLFESFVAALVLRDGSEPPVASFWGKPPEVGFLPLPPLFMAFEGDGRQEERSRSLVELLLRYLDAPLGPQIGSAKKR